MNTKMLYPYRTNVYYLHLLIMPKMPPCIVFHDFYFRDNYWVKNTNKGEQSEWRYKRLAVASSL